MDLILCDLNPDMVDAYTEVFADVPDVKVFEGDIIEDSRADCFVNAANSYGIMGAGVAGALASHFGETLTRAVKEDVHDNWGGKTPVGCASLVMPFEDGPDFIMSPTMERPGTKISGTDNVYQAARATFELMRDMDFADYLVAMPGMGTGIGGLSPTECAKQVRQAYAEVFEQGEE